MRAFTPSSSASKANTTPHRLQARAIVGGALIGFLVMKSEEARSQLVSVTKTASLQGALSMQDAAIVQQVLMMPARTTQC